MLAAARSKLCSSVSAWLGVFASIAMSSALSEYFDIVAGVLQGDTLIPYLFIICLDYVLRTSIDKIRENVFELTKKRSRDVDNADDIAILANTPDQAETLMHSFERAASM